MSRFARMLPAPMRRSLSNAIAGLVAAQAPPAPAVEFDLDVDNAPAHDWHADADDVAAGVIDGAANDAPERVHHEPDDDGDGAEQLEVGDAPGVQHENGPHQERDALLDDAVFDDDDDDDDDDDEQDGIERDGGHEGERDLNDDGVNPELDNDGYGDAPADQILDDAADAPDAAPDADVHDADVHDADADADAAPAPASLINTAVAQGWFRLGYIQPHLDTISGKGQDAARWLHANVAWLRSLTEWNPFDFLRALAMLIGVAILITMSRYNLPYRAADFLFSMLQKLFCIFCIVLPTTVRQFCSETSLGLIFADESERGLIRTMIRCKKCARLYERNQCSRIENDGHGVRHERTRYCKNRSAGAYTVECDAPLLEERIVDGATRCIVARSQEFYYFPVKDQLQSLLQRPGVVEHLWHHLNWPQQRGVLHDVYDGTEWQEWKHRGWFNSNQYQVGLRLLIDGYQPFKHTVSNMTPVFLEILNLPAHVRQQIPHQIPIALVPGPKDTASEMYFELLRPIVKELRQLYAGVNMPVYVPAAERIEERSVSAVLVVTSFDTPACRKCLGFLFATSKHTCSKCAFNIHETLGARSWLLRYAPRSAEVHRRYGAAWLKTKTPQDMKAYEQGFGFRWTSLLDLPYVDTIRIHTVEPFHLVFLNLDKNVLKELLGKTTTRRVKAAPAATAEAAALHARSCASEPASSSSASSSSSSSSRRRHRAAAASAPPRDDIDDAHLEYVDIDAEEDSDQDEDEEDEADAEAADADAADLNADSDTGADSDADTQGHARGAPRGRVSARGRGRARAARGCARTRTDAAPSRTDASSSGRVLTETKCDIMQERMKRLDLPRHLGRIPLKLASGFAGLKADELKVIFAVAMPSLLLHDMLHTKSVGTRAPAVNDNAPLHRMIITALCHINRFVCMRPMTEFALRVLDELAMRFTSVFMNAYPATRYPSLHLVSHLADCCRLYGPASAFWTFLLERLQGLLAATHNNYTHVGITTCQRLLLSQALIDVSQLRVRTATEPTAELVGLSDLCTRLGLPIAWFQHEKFDSASRKPPPAGASSSFAFDILGEWYWCSLRLHHPVYHAALEFLGATKWPVPTQREPATSADAPAASSSSSSSTASPAMFPFAFSSDTMSTRVTGSTSTTSSSSSSSSRPLYDELVHRADFTRAYGDATRHAHHKVPLFVPMFPAAPQCVSPVAGGNVLDLLNVRKTPNKIVVPGWTAQQILNAFVARADKNGRFATHQHIGFALRHFHPTAEYRIARIASARVYQRLMMRPDDEACKIDSMMWSRSTAERSLVLVCCPIQDEFVHHDVLYQFRARDYSSDRSFLHPAIVCAFVQFDCDLVLAEYARLTHDWKSSYRSNATQSGFVASAPAIFAMVNFLRPHQNAACFQWSSLAEMWDFENHYSGANASYLIPISRICSRAAGVRLTKAEVADLDTETHHGIAKWASRSFDKLAAPIIITPLPSH